MTFRFRISLLITGFLVFILVGPAIVLFARGYSYDFENHRFLKTGALVIRTEPRGADVYLEGKLIGSAPLTKRLLLPDEYYVEVKKTEFRPWQKHVAISPQGVTDYSHVVLFKEALTPEVMATSTTDFLALDDDIYASIKGSLVLFRFDSALKTVLATSTTIANLASEIPETEKGNESVIYGDKNEIWLLRQFEGREEKSLITRSAAPIENPVLNRETGYVFFQVGKTIKAIELDKNGVPNTYDLLETKHSATKFALSPDGRTLIYLEGGTLFRLNIR